MTTVSSRQRFSRAHPCPICGGWDQVQRGHARRCYGFLSEDGAWANCTREELAGGLERAESSETFAHRLSGDCRCGERHGAPAPAIARRLDSVHDYPTSAGDLLYQVLRYVPKDFKQRRPDGRGGWVWNLRGIEPILYRLPDLAAADPAAWVWVVEGEKDVDRAVQLGLVATTNSGGAGKWPASGAQALAGRRVVVVPDQDDKGRAHAVKVRHALLPVVAELRTVNLSGAKDLSQWLDQGHTVAELEALLTAATAADFEQRPATAEDGADEPRGLDDLAIKRLRLRSFAQLLEGPPPAPVVDGWVDRGELVLLVGRFGGGKSLVALDLCCSLAAGVPWLDTLPIRPGPALYVVAEGRNSVAPRVAAWCKARGVHPDRLEGQLWFALGRADLGSPEWAGALVRAVNQYQVVDVVIDTLAQASPGKDENSARDMGQVLSVAQDLTLLPSRPAVHLLHHFGKDVAKGARGNTSIPAAVDVEIVVKGPARALTISTDKLRNHQAPASVMVSLSGSPPVLHPKRLGLDEIIHGALAQLAGGLPYRIRYRVVCAWIRSALPRWVAPGGALDAAPSREAVSLAFERLIKAGPVKLQNDHYVLKSSSTEVPGVKFLHPPSSALADPAPPASTISPPIERGRGGNAGAEAEGTGDGEREQMELLGGERQSGNGHQPAIEVEADFEDPEYFAAVMERRSEEGEQ